MAFSCEHFDNVVESLDCTNSRGAATPVPEVTARLDANPPRSPP